MIRCKFENNRGVSLRHVTVGAIAVNGKGEFLLVKRAPNIINANKYTIPGGFLDRGEDTKKGALRELFEETGLLGKIRFLFRVNDSPNRPKEDRQNVDFIYVVDIVGGEIQISREGESVGWFNKQSLPSEEEFAFDHHQNILLYLKYLKNQSVLPIIG